MKTNRTRDEAVEARDADVVAWRFDQLLAAGFGPTASYELSRDCSIDLHELLDLVDSGSPPELAARILAPLDGESRAC